MYRRRKLDDEDEGHERWLISYADFITLLFAFFVVMYATSTINLNKYRALSSAVFTAFQGNPGQMAAPDAPTQANLQSQSSVIKPLPLSYLYQEKKQRDQEKIRALGQQLANTLTPWIEQKQVAVYQSEVGIEVDILSQLLFNGDQAVLATQASQVLAALGVQLKNEYRTIQVEGHIDRHGLSSSNDAEAKRWELTSLQAARITASLVSQGIANKQLSAIGMADTKPLSSSDNALAQTLNSRITLRILSAETSTQLNSNIANRLEILPKAAEAIPETAPVQTMPAASPAATLAVSPANP